MRLALELAGATLYESEDGMVIDGTGGAALRGGNDAPVATHLDHRIAMSMAVAGLASASGVLIDDTGPIATSFPNFLALMEGLRAS
jgi:3-phosphoshikimate 1-carboxyvinyltransferase